MSIERRLLHKALADHAVFLAVFATAPSAAAAYRPASVCRATPYLISLNFFATLRRSGGVNGGGFPAHRARLIAMSANMIGHRPSMTANNISAAIRHSSRSCVALGNAAM